MIDYAKLLNEEQYEAVTAGEGLLLVLAAAGTGKTRTLVYRVAYLAEHGVLPENQLLLTFTNRAAKEMIARAKGLVGDSIGSLWSGTFHHVCNRFLRRYASFLGYRNDFVILDRDDSRSLIDKCIKEVTRNTKDFPKKDVIGSWIGLSINRGCDLMDVIQERASSLKVDPSDIIRVARLYSERKFKLGAMDFDDLLLNGLRLFETQENILARYQEQFRHVLVDEYQDTNPLQAKIVDLLAAKSRNVTAVGDDFQCIYSWRGADFKNIMDFPKRWEGCRIIKLEQNYRSTPEVLSLANDCIKGNPGQFQKELRATRPSRRKPQLYLLRDGDEQARAILGLVQRYLDQGYKLKDMAVLYRAHFHSIELQMMIARTGIPYEITSGTGVFEQVHTKDVLALLRVCEHTTDQLAFMRLMMLLSGVGEKTAESYWVKLGGRFDARDADQREKLCKMLRPAACGQWRPIDRLLGEYFAEDLGQHGGEMVERFCDEFYRDHLIRKYDNAETREEDIHELAVQLSKKGTVAEFLEDVALLTNVDHSYEKQREQTGDEKNVLRLSTIHQAKGLEWSIVFLIWVNEGMFPTSRSIEEGGDDSEERRLFYVAVTRAKDELVICSPAMRRTKDGGCFFCAKSRFITEVNKKIFAEHYGFRI